MSSGNLVNLRGQTLPTPGQPDPEVIALAEDILERARSGDINSIQAVVAHSDGSCCFKRTSMVNWKILGSLTALSWRVTKILDE